MCWRVRHRWVSRANPRSARQRRERCRALRAARFPARKSLEDFDHQRSLKRDRTGERNRGFARLPTCGCHHALDPPPMVGARTPASLLRRCLCWSRCIRPGRWKCHARSGWRGISGRGLRADSVAGEAQRSAVTTPRSAACCAGYGRARRRSARPLSVGEDDPDLARGESHPLPGRGSEGGAAVAVRPGPVRGPGLTVAQDQGRA